MSSNLNNWKKIESIGIGSIFGKLTVMRDLGIPNSTRKERRYECLCACGTISSHRGSHLKSGEAKSCGCTTGKGKLNTSWKGCEELNGAQFGKIKRGATVRKIPFELTVEAAWERYSMQEGKCALTGLPLSLREKSDFIKNDPSTASLDRIDSSKGYTVGNIQWLHKDLNFVRGQLSQEKIIEYCQLVVEHQKQNEK